MTITDKLIIANIDSDKLQKGLKHIGLNLSRFDGVVEEQVPGLLELFKIAVDIDPKTTTKFTKMDLRSKLEKVLKAKPKGTAKKGQVSLFFDWKKNRYYEKIEHADMYAFEHENIKPIQQQPVESAIKPNVQIFALTQEDLFELNRQEQMSKQTEAPF